MEDEIRKAKAAAIYKAAEQTVINLAGRWIDESQYEDIEDYAKPLIPIVAQLGGKVVKMNKRPFGFDFEIGGARYQVRCTATTYSYRRIEAKAVAS